MTSVDPAAPSTQEVPLDLEPSATGVSETVLDEIPGTNHLGSIEEDLPHTSDLGEVTELASGQIADGMTESDESVPLDPTELAITR